LTFGQNTISTIEAQEKFNLFIRETQISQSSSGTMRIGWYIPFELWEVIIDMGASTSERDKNELKEILRPYTFFALAHGELANVDNISRMDFAYQSKEEMVKTLTLTGNDGKIHSPLDENDLDYQVQSVLELFTPIFSKMMGNLGENFHFFVFTDRRGSLPRVANPLIVGQIVFQTSGITYSYKTPFASLIPKKECPVDQEIMNGNWKYCPYHGEMLPERNN
jgi:hypothetical protein